MKIHQVDSFTNERFKSNPAAVCILPKDQSFDNEWIQNVSAERLGKSRMKALQLSKRGGALEIEVKAGRVEITGQAITVLKGELCE